MTCEPWSKNNNTITTTTTTTTTTKNNSNNANNNNNNNNTSNLLLSLLLLEDLQLADFGRVPERLLLSVRTKSINENFVNRKLRPLVYL